MKIGVHLPNDGPVSDAEIALIRDSGVNILKGLLRLDLNEDPTDWRKLPVVDEYILRLYAPMREPWRTSGFAELAICKLEYVLPFFRDVGKVLVEIHNEPNHPNEGFGPSHDGAFRWKAWYQNVYTELRRWRDQAGLRSRVRLGWPGLALTEWAHKEKTYIAANKENIRNSEWVGAHCYWQTPTDDWGQMRDFHYGRNYGPYHSLLSKVVTSDCPTCGQQWTKEARGDVPIYVTEAGNSNCHGAGFRILSPYEQAEQYTQWCEMAYGYVAGVTFFMLGGSEDWAGFRLYPETVMALGDMAKQYATLPKQSKTG